MTQNIIKYGEVILGENVVLGDNITLGHKDDGTLIIGDNCVGTEFCSVIDIK